MTPDLIILLISSLSSILIGAVFFVKINKIDIIDVHVIMIAFFFYLYAIVDVFINDYSYIDVSFVVLLFTWLFLNIAVLWLSPHVFFGRYLEVSRLENLARTWSCTSNKELVVLAILVFFIFIYGYINFGVLTNIDYHDISEADIQLPYWYKVSTFYLRPLIFCLFLAISSKLIYGKIKNKFVFSICLFFPVIISMLYGRRAVFILLVIFGLLLLAKPRYKKLKYFSKKIYVLLPVIVLFVVFSNLFQVYRPLLQNIGENNVVNIAEPELALDPSITHSNLESRMAMWRFNYMLIEKQGVLSSESYGDIFIQAVKNIIPSVLLENKEYIDLDYMVSDKYEIHEKDYPTNTFAVSYADFGYASFIFNVILILVISFTFILITIFFKKYPLLFLLLTGRIIYYLMNIENNYADILVVYRDIIIIIAVFLPVMFFSKNKKYYAKYSV